MKVVYHPEFSKDIRRFADEYGKAYPALGERFKHEAFDAVAAIKAGPNHAGHLARITSSILKHARRRNLPSFPFFLLYTVTSDTLWFASVLPSRSNPVSWLSRIQAWNKSEDNPI
jgi:hypothetical protein